MLKHKGRRRREPWLGKGRGVQEILLFSHFIQMYIISLIMSNKIGLFKFPYMT